MSDVWCEIFPIVIGIALFFFAPPRLCGEKRMKNWELLAHHASILCSLRRITQRDPEPLSSNSPPSCRPEWRHLREAPNYKLQITNKFEILISKSKTTSDPLVTSSPKTSAEARVRKWQETHNFARYYAVWPVFRIVFFIPVLEYGSKRLRRIAWYFHFIIEMSD